MKNKLFILACFLFFTGSTAYSISTYYLPHVAIGNYGTGSFRTTFVLFNNKSGSATVTLKLTNDDGTPMSVTIPGLGTNNTFSFSLGAGATKIIQTDNSGNAKGGAATVVSDSDIGVAGLFTVYDSNGAFVTEVGVGNSNPQKNFIIPVQVSGSVINTGLALFNPSTTDSSITASLTNSDGTAAGNTTFTLPAGQHKGIYVDGDLFKNVSNFKGTLTVQSSVAISAMTLRQNAPSSSALAYTSCPVVPTSSAQTSFNLAQVVDGASSTDSYKTTFMLFNLSSNTANVTLALTNDDGTPFSVTIPDQSASAKSTFNLTIDAGKSLFLQTSGTGPISQGAAVITSNVAISATGLFTHFDATGNFQTEAGVQDSPAQTDFTLPIDSRKPAADTGIALFNPGTASVTITPRFLDASGVSTTLKTPILIPVNGHYAGYFGDLFTGLGSVQGTLAISAPKAISALTMRQNFSPFGMTSLPVVPGVVPDTSNPKVTMDGTVDHAVLASGSSLTVTHTTGTGSNRLMLVGVGWNDNTATPTISSVTFTPDGGAAVSLTEVITQKPATVARYAAIYSIVNPPSGKSGTVTVTFTDSVPSGVVAGAANFAGVDQTTPLGTPVGFASADNTSTALTVTLTGLTGNELIFDTAYQGGSGATQTLTANAGQTELWNDFATNTRSAASTSQATSSSVTMSWTAGAAAWSTMVAVPIKPATK